ncbi:MAG: protein-glutamate O-methyltransferase family protein [Anaerolineae bacterium]|nr:protein-glutamate O-methyltransferase family protein [Anaerolineae bacterium]
MPTYPQFNPTQPPPPLMTGEPGSFAYKTLTTRKPVIIRQVLADYAGDYPPAIVRRVEALYEELTLNQPVQPLETAAADGASWQQAWQPYQGRGWLDIPWYLAESFLYRRLLEATNYFGGNGPDIVAWQGVDPFLPRKQAELSSDTPWQVLAAALSHSEADSLASLRALLHHCVWGNRIDLSYNQVAQDAGREIAVDSEQANLLVDDTDQVVNYLSDRRSAAGRIDFICDNSGTELLMDLALADFLLRFEWAQPVTLHVKAHPTFVSDATPADIDMTIAAIEAKGSPFTSLARRLSAQILRERLKIRAHIFWNSSRFFWEIPPTLTASLAQAQLVIFKGDANYRRLVGDSRWPAAVPFADAVPYFPAPLLTLRTMKSDPIVGLQPGQAEALDRVDAEWRVNGKRGVIQALI